MSRRYSTVCNDEAFWEKEFSLEDQLIAKLDKRPITMQEIKTACAVFLKKVFE